MITAASINAQIKPAVWVAPVPAADYMTSFSETFLWITDVWAVHSNWESIALCFRFLGSVVFEYSYSLKCWLQMHALPLKKLKCSPSTHISGKCVKAQVWIFALIICALGDAAVICDCELYLLPLFTISLEAFKVYYIGFSIGGWGSLVWILHRLNFFGSIMRFVHWWSFQLKGNTVVHSSVYGKKTLKAQQSIGMFWPCFYI